MKYDSGTEDFKNWVVTENDFQEKFQGKCETIFCLGNGYMGIRSATEESYIGQVRDTFVAGTFNKCDENEVTELPNAADVIGMDIFIDGERFSLNKGEFSNYSRSLNLKTGEMVRAFVWKNEAGKSFQFEFKRFVSMLDLHTLAASVSIQAIDQDANILIKSGLNGQVSNTGAQHFKEGEKRIFDKQYLQMLQHTNQSEIDFVHNTFHDFSTSEIEMNARFEMDRRKVLMVYEGSLEKGKTLAFTKISNIYTSRDKEVSALSLNDIREFSIERLKINSEKGYNALLEESANAWKKYWDKMDILIESDNNYDQLVIRFAQYHLFVMTPKHDNRYGIGAKGLSGEGYKGHSFWDTEIFILPFFIYTFPEIARSLLEYRFNTIQGARNKAKDNGYEGAMYPWESAWADDGEVTPVWGAVDIITGKSTKIWSGFIEQHITSDVAFATWQYYQVTGDEDFMEKYGYEILVDTGIFWGSRLEWNEEKQEYHINDVVGPDEYKEHVNNDAFTNYMARWCMSNAIEYYHHLKENRPKTFTRLNAALNLDEAIQVLKEKIEKIYIPEPNEDMVIPQDDTYLQKKLIDLTQYKNQEHVGSIFKDYNLDQVNSIQVSKQASVVMLMYLLEHLFSHDIKEANYHYYEPKTLHDSSLSLSTHAVLAADVDNLPLSYQLFRKAAEIDMGPNMKTSDHGIHAASLGGVWQIIVCGFGGMRMVGGKLRINPKLPKEIERIVYPINWQGNLIKVEVTHSSVNLKNEGKQPIQLTVFRTDYILSEELTIELVYQH